MPAGPLCIGWVVIADVTTAGCDDGGIDVVAVVWLITGIIDALAAAFAFTFACITVMNFVFSIESIYSFDNLSEVPNTYWSFECPWYLDVSSWHDAIDFLFQWMLYRIDCNQTVFRQCANDDVRPNVLSIWNPSDKGRNGMGVQLLHLYYGYADGRANFLWAEMIFHKFHTHMAALPYDIGWNSMSIFKLSNYSWDSERRFPSYLIWLTSDSFLENDLLHTVQINGLSGEWCFKWLFKCSLRVKA